MDVSHAKWECGQDAHDKRGLVREGFMHTVGNREQRFCNSSELLGEEKLNSEGSYKKPYFIDCMDNKTYFLSCMHHGCKLMPVIGHVGRMWRFMETHALEWPFTLACLQEYAPHQEHRARLARDEQRTIGGNHPLLASGWSLLVLYSHWYDVPRLGGNDNTGLHRTSHQMFSSDKGVSKNRDPC